MASMRDIKRRKTSIQGTQQITKAMKLVSTVKLQRARAGAERSQTYFDSIITQVLGDFYYQFSSISGRDADRVIDLRKFALIEAYIQYGTDDLGDPSFILSCHFYLFPAH